MVSGDSVFASEAGSRGVAAGVGSGATGLVVITGVLNGVGKCRSPVEVTGLVDVCPGRATDRIWDAG